MPLCIDRRAFPRPPAACAAVLLGAAAACDCGGGLRVLEGGIAVSPAVVDFGEVSIGAEARRLVEIRNTGNGALELGPIALARAGAAGDGGAQFTLERVLAADCEGRERAGSATSLEVAGCARVEIRFAPTTRARAESTLVVESADTAAPRIEIPVRGVGVRTRLKICVLSAEGEVLDRDCTHFGDADPARANSVPAVEFGSVADGQTATRLVRLLDEGDGPVVVSDVRAQSDFPDITMDGGRFAGTIDAGRSVDVRVRFTAQGDGARNGSLLVVSGDPARPRVELPILGQALGPRLCIQPATGLDFGAVPVGETRRLTLGLRNCGAVAYDISALAFEADDPAAGAFAPAPGAIPALPRAFPPGDSLDVELDFEPPSVATFTGRFSISTWFRSERIPVTGDGTPAACAGEVVPTAAIRVNKGSQDITANPLVQPLDTVGFDASGSTVLRGGATYRWSLASQPQNGTQNVVPRANPAFASLFAALDGDYVVEVVVGDGYGCESAPARVRVHVASRGRLHMQLTWAQGYGDVDLHLVGPGGTFADAGLGGGASDCFFASCKGIWGDPGYGVDWGLGGTTRADSVHTNDPTLDIDRLWGNGPENITDTAPFDAAYTAVVHYYCARPESGAGYGLTSFGPVDATLRIFVNGEERHAATRRLSQRDKWTVATIAVSNRGSTVVVAPSGSPVVKSTGDLEACTADTF